MEHRIEFSENKSSQTKIINLKSYPNLSIRLFMFLLLKQVDFV